MNLPRETVILCEPQCCGFEHALPNAALLCTVRRAYQSAEIVFFGEHEHLEHVRREPALPPHEGDHVSFQPMRVPERAALGWERLPAEFAWCNRILSEASRVRAKMLILCSINETGLLALKTSMHLGRFRLPTLAVVHGCLAGIAGRQSRRPWNWIIGLRRVLALPHPANLHLIALGDSILHEVSRLQPTRKRQWKSLDLAYLWPSNCVTEHGEPEPLDRPLRFGYLGVSTKGFDTFCRLADEIAPPPQAARFVMAGFHAGPAHEKPNSRFVPDIPEHPLTRPEYEARARQLAYAVWTADPSHYHLTASATFLDALAFLKPGIYLRNAYVEHYFEQMGDIGYLCDSYEQMVDTVGGIIQRFPKERYLRQVENIRKGRVVFEPATLAARLREIARGCQNRAA